MDLTKITLYKTLVMTILAIVGILSFKFKIIDSQFNKKLSELVLTLFTPILLFISFQIDIEPSLIEGFKISIMLSILSFILVWFISKIFVKNQQKDYASVEHISLIYSNCGFIGIPLAQGIFGIEGILYMTVYVAIMNFLIWSHGIIVMSGKSDIKSLRNVFKSPTILSIILGITFFLLKIHIPEIIKEPLVLLAGINTPMAMIVAGVNIAQTDIAAAFLKKRLYLISIIKLLVIPLILAFLLKLSSINTTVKAIAILSVACPSGVTGSLFALRFKKDALYASEIFAITTVFSIFSIPFMMLFI